MRDKHTPDADEEITGKMFERAKALGYDVDHPSREDYLEVTKRLEKEYKEKSGLPPFLDNDRDDDFGVWMAWRCGDLDDYGNPTPHGSLAHRDDPPEEDK